MSTKVLVVCYSTFGHVFQLAHYVEEGARRQPDSEVRLHRVPELPEARGALSGTDAHRQAQEAQQYMPEATHDVATVWRAPRGRGRVCWFNLPAAQV